MSVMSETVRKSAGNEFRSAGSGERKVYRCNTTRRRKRRPTLCKQQQPSYKRRRPRSTIIFGNNSCRYVSGYMKCNASDCVAVNNSLLLFDKAKLLNVTTQRAAANYSVARAYCLPFVNTLRCMNSRSVNGQTQPLHSPPANAPHQN